MACELDDNAKGKAFGVNQSEAPVWLFPFLLINDYFYSNKKCCVPGVPVLTTLPRSRCIEATPQECHGSVRGTELDDGLLTLSPRALPEVRVQLNHTSTLGSEKMRKTHYDVRRPPQRGVSVMANSSLEV